MSVINHSIHAGKIKEMILDKCDPLTREEEKVASNHDLVKHNLRFMISSFKSYLNHMNFSEYVSEIINAMYIAAEKYDRTKNIRYNTYARNWVSVMLWDYKRVFLNNGYYNNVSICASTWKKLVKLNKFKQQFINDNGRVPEKSDYMKEESFKGYSDDVLNKHIFFASNGYERSTEDLIGNHDNPDKVRTFGESLDQTNVYSEDEFIGLAEEVERKDLLDNIYSRINNFNGIEKQVATCLYVDNMSQRECAKQLCISSPTVANINERIIATLRKDMALFD